ncbi:MAG: rod shape-determining protein MreC, partial [Candidatus Omnitrophica bacterium]|nr:rod shape-determining protein MreC [Candidatus Omnitrophota bacterium]
RLRELLRFKKETKFATIPAEVMARNPNDWIGSFVIDRGSDDGIERNAAVCSAKGLLGKVIETSDGSSQVMLLSHPSFKVGGMIKRTLLNGIIVGTGEEDLRMLYLPADSDVQIGDVVVTSGFSRIFPRDIPIGEVVSVEVSKTKLYKYVRIKPFANPFDQEEVLCVK